MPVVSGTAYATSTDLASLGLVSAALANVGAGVQTAALAAASAVVDSKIQSRYVLPLTQWGQDLVRAVCVIAAYDIMTSRGYNPMAGADQNIRQRYLDAIEWLENVGKGTDTPSQVVDSSTTSGTGSSDDSITTQTRGGLQMTTSAVRGWTGRGVSGSTADDPWRS